MYFYAIFTLQKKGSANFKSLIPTPPPVTWNLKHTITTVPGHVEVAVTHRGSGHRSLSKWQLPAIEVAVARRRRGHHPPSRNRPSPVFAAAFACCRQPSQLLSPPPCSRHCNSGLCLLLHAFATAVACHHSCRCQLSIVARLPIPVFRNPFF